jgi:hypothetical protein
MQTLAAALSSGPGKGPWHGLRTCQHENVWLTAPARAVASTATDLRTRSEKPDGPAGGRRPNRTVNAISKMEWG